jgi:hypothetical protein
MKNYHRTDFSSKKVIKDKRRNINKLNDPLIGVYTIPNFYAEGEYNYNGICQSSINDEYYPYWAVNFWLIPGTFSVN